MAMLVNMVLPANIDPEPIAIRISDRWGGVSVLAGWGMWSQLRERINVFYVGCGTPQVNGVGKVILSRETNESIRGWWRTFAHEIAALYNQEAVFVAFGVSQFELVTGIVKPTEEQVA